MRTPTAAVPLAALLAISSIGSSAHAQGVAADGQKIFGQRCAVCHGVAAAEKKPLGPHLAGIIGRKSAAVAEFKYSAAFAGLNRTWDEKGLDEFLAAPAKMAPGTTMVVGVPQAADREDLVAYLKTLK